MFGPRGADGTPGARGEIGEVGYDGPYGPVGDMGDMGSIGQRGKLQINRKSVMNTNSLNMFFCRRPWTSRTGWCQKF